MYFVNLHKEIKRCFYPKHRAISNEKKNTTKIIMTIAVFKYGIRGLYNIYSSQLGEFYLLLSMLNTQQV